MKGLGALARLARRRILRWTRTGAEIDRLASGDHALAAPLARALRGTLSGSASPEERAWIDSIEALRLRTNRSTEPLTLLKLVPPGEGAVMNRIPLGRASRSSKSPQWCRMLFRLVRELRPASCLEMGTNIGISASYQAAALSLNGAGKLVTIEGQPDSVAAARRHLASIGLEEVELVCGAFSVVLPGVLDEHGPFDYVFVDGHHDGPATVGYFNQIAEHLAAPAVVVFDDIDWSEGMRRAWREIAADRRWAVVVDLYKVGLAVYDPAAGSRAAHRIAVR